MTDSISVSVPRPLMQRAILVSVTLGCMLVPLNSTMIAIALPNIMRQFGADVNAAGWLVSAYLITIATFQLIAGKLGDQLGRRALLLGGLIYFGLASALLACGLGMRLSRCGAPGRRWQTPLAANGAILELDQHWRSLWTNCKSEPQRDIKTAVAHVTAMKAY